MGKLGESKRELWHNLWQDDRKFINRVGLAALPCFLTSFMYLIWEPINLYASNIEFFPFSFSDLLIPFLLLGIAVFIAGSAIAALFRGRVFNWIICLIFGFALASYLQAMVLNLNLGILDGSSIPWQSYAGHSVSNILIWFIIILIPFVILYFFKNAWGKIVKAISFILIGAQAVALVTALIAMPAENKSTGYYLSGEEQYTVSSKSNVIVFIIDYCSNTYIDRVLANYPDMLDAFNDFTFYNNADCSYFGTFPSITHLLTGSEMDTSITTEEWFKESWNSKKACDFYNILAKDNYKVNIYSLGACYGNYKNMLGKVSNLEVKTKITVDYISLIKKMTKLSCYNYFPHALKASFWMDTNDFANVVEEDNTTYAKKNESEYFSALKAQGLTLNDKSNYFIFQHLRGAHPAYHVDENGEYSENATLEQTVRGYFLMIEEYIQQLKELGAYDNSTIIITSDHGSREDLQVIYFIKEANVTHNEMQISTAPISHNDFMPTILANMGEDYSEFGSSIYDFGENDQRERTVMVRDYNDQYPSVPKYKSSDEGSANVYDVYTYVGDSQDLIEEMKKGPIQVIPMKDSFF